MTELTKEERHWILNPARLPVDGLLSWGYHAGVDIGKELRRLRNRSKLTTRELAARAGISSAAVSQIETGKHLPTLPTLRALAKALGKSVRVKFVAPEKAK